MSERLKIQIGLLASVQSYVATLVLVRVAEERSFPREGGGDELGRHGEVRGAVGAGVQRVEGIVTSSPHGVLIWHQLRGSLLNNITVDQGHTVMHSEHVEQIHARSYK